MVLEQADGQLALVMTDVSLARDMGGVWPAYVARP